MNTQKSGAMRAAIPFAIVIVLALVLFFWGKGVYNGLVVKDEKVKSAWSQVENQYQRRMDLIPNLVATVRGYAEHEAQTLENVINARANATRVTINAEQLDQTALMRFQADQSQVTSALSRLMAVAEAYPDLKANKNFEQLQVQLEGTENRISVERKRFNDTAEDYNGSLRSFPTNILAGILGFQPRPYFAAESGAQTAPRVSFDGDNR